MILWDYDVVSTKLESVRYREDLVKRMPQVAFRSPSFTKLASSLSFSILFLFIALLYNVCIPIQEKSLSVHQYFFRLSADD